MIDFSMMYSVMVGVFLALLAFWVVIGLEDWLKTAWRNWMDERANVKWAEAHEKKIKRTKQALIELRKVDRQKRGKRGR